MKRFYLTLLCACPLWSQSITRDVVATAGQTDRLGNLSLSWTLGEFASGTFDRGEVLTQGFQQGEVYEVTPVSTGPALAGVRVFPNPTYGNLQVQLGDKPDNYFYQLFDASGRTLSSRVALSGSRVARLDLSEYSGGYYILKIFTDTQEKAKTFKIVKKK